MSAPDPSERFEAFVSYSTKSDYRFVRGVERFLETFHRFSAAKNRHLPALRICVDGSDFSVRKTDEEIATAGVNAGAWETIESYLRRSDCLLVCCSKAAAKSAWVAREVEWWLAHRGGSDLYLMVGESTGEAGANEETVPKPALDARIHEKIWYDLRNFRVRRKWGEKRTEEGRDPEEELVRLACDLHRVEVREVLPGWLRDERRRSQRNLRRAVGVGVFMMGLAVFALYSRGSAIQAERSERGARLSLEAETLIERDPSRSGALLMEALGPPPAARARAVGLRWIQRRLRHLLHTSGIGIIHLAWEPRTGRLLSLDRGGQVTAWDPMTWLPHQGPLQPEATSMACLPDGRIVLGTSSGKIAAFDANDRQLGLFAVANDRITVIRAAQRTPSLIVGTERGDTYLLHIHRTKIDVLARLSAPNPARPVRDIAISHDDTRAAIGYADGKLRFVQRSSLRLLRVEDSGFALTDLAWDDAGFLFVANGDGRIGVSLDGTAPLEFVAAVPGDELTIARVHAHLAVGNSDGTIWILDLMNHGRVLGSFNSGASVDRLEWLPETHQLVSASTRNENVRLFDLESMLSHDRMSGERVLAMTAMANDSSRERVVSAFVPDLPASGTHVIRVSDMRDSSFHGEIAIPDNRPPRLSMAPSGDRILIGDRSVLRMWDLARPAPSAPFEANAGLVVNAAWSPDRRSVTVLYRGGQAVTFAVDSFPSTLRRYQGLLGHCDVLSAYRPKPESWVAASSELGRLFFFPAGSEKPFRRAEVMADARFSTIAPDPVSGATLLGTFEGTVFHVGEFEGSARTIFKMMGAPVVALDWSPSGNEFLAAWVTGYVAVFDSRSLNLVSDYQTRIENLQVAKWNGQGDRITCGGGSASTFGHKVLHYFSLDALKDSLRAEASRESAARISVEKSELDRWSGLGLEVAADPRGILITSVVPSGPAVQSGILAGMVVTHADGLPLKGLSLEQASRIALSKQSAATILRLRPKAGGKELEFRVTARLREQATD